MIRSLAFVSLITLAASSARGEDLVSGISQDQIQITSNYAGTDIVVFGAIESPEAGEGAGKRDVVVVVRGPPADFSVRRKVWVAGIWINRDEIVLRGLPGYYYIASTRHLSKIAQFDTLDRYQLGPDNLQPKSASTRSPKKAEPFRLAAIRSRLQASLYGTAPQGVEFLSYALFRVRVPVPASVPRGQYTVEVYLFRDGNVVSAQTTPLYIEQIGLERRLFNLAHDWPFEYGFATVVMAGLLGWGSSFLFRRSA